MGTDVTNTFLLKFFIYHQNCGRHKFRRFVGFRRGVAYSCNKPALRIRLRCVAYKATELNLYPISLSLNLKSQFLSLIVFALALIVSEISLYLL